MTKKKKIIQRIIALVLVAALWWQTDSMRFFVTAFAAETENVVIENTNLLSDSDVSESDTTDVPVTVLGEVETLRTEGEKHFRMSDGSFMAVSYGMPVHYQDEDGNWQDIDNRMVLSEDQATYQTYNLQSTTNFASSLTEGILFETSYDDTSVTMSLLDTVNADSLMRTETEIETGTDEEMEAEPEIEAETQVLEQEIITETINPDLLVFDRTAVADTTVEVQDVLGSISDTSQADNKDKGWTMEDILPENIQDSLLYEDVFPGVDLLYTKYSHNVKEQIIVNSVQNAYRYDFMLTLDGVEAILNEDGSVSLVEEENLENEIYYIPAPFMEDADGIVSYDVEYMLADVPDGVILTVVADAEWMNEEERVFPVAIDPTVIINAKENEKELYIMYTSQGYPNASYNTGFNHAGYLDGSTSFKELCTLVHFNILPKIPEGMTVVDGHLYLAVVGYTRQSCDELGLGIYEVTESSPTGTDYKDWFYSRTWSTMPTYDATNLIDYTMVSEAMVNEYASWDITELLKKWYIEGTQNKTVSLQMVSGTCGKTNCGCARFVAFGENGAPVVAVSYRNTVGTEPYYTYQSMGVGDAGTAYIADATGQLKVVNPLITYASTVNPFSLSLVYSSDYFAGNGALYYQPMIRKGTENIVMKAGHGWTLDIVQTMHTEMLGETLYLCYSDGDDTHHYFTKDDKRNSEDNSDKEFYYDEDGLGLKAEITNEEKTSFAMYDDNGNKWTFANNRLTRVADEAGNAYVITWNSSNQITHVKQFNAGSVTPVTVAEFTYSEEYVSSITDAAGNVYSFTYTNERLVGISRNGVQTAEYYYPGNQNHITSMKDIKSGYTRIFGYTHGKVAGSSEHVNGIFGASFSVSYPNYSKTVYTTTSDEGTLHTSYLFDYAQRTINAYVTDEFDNILGATNAVYVEKEEDSPFAVNRKANRTEKTGGIGISNPSLFLYGGCENTGWTFHAAPTEAHYAAYNNTYHRTGNYSLKMVSGNAGGALYASGNSVQLASGETYTLSAYLRTTECESFTGEGIRLKVTDSAGNSYIGKGISYSTSSQIDDGWARIHTTFTPSAAGAHTISIYAEGVTGTFYVDDVQLEKGETAGTLDLLKDGSNESGSLQWSGNYINNSVTGGWNDSNAIKITGNPKNNSYAYQTVNVNLPATETFVLSGWAMGNSVPDNVTTHSDENQDTQKQFGLRAKITYAGVTTPEYHYVAFNPDVNEWQFASLSIVPKDPTKTISTIEVACVFAGNANIAYFDNISLTREVAQTMTYDDDGNLKAVNTPGLKEDANTYQGGNLMQSITGGNGTYNYTYDTTYKHRLTNVRDGVVTQSFTYDRFGNTIGTALKSFNANYSLSITSSATYSSDGNRITSLTDSKGNQVEYEYGTTSSVMYALPTTTTDGSGNSTDTAYDSYGRTTEVEVPELVSVSYAYEQGLLTSIEREDVERDSMQEYRFTYDTFGRTTAVYSGDRLLASYAYRNTGEMISMTYANGTTVEYEYDILGRVIKEIFKSGNTEKRTVEYTYDGNSQINSIKDSVSGTENYVYDRLGRVVYYENEETNVRCSYTYDENSRLIKTSYDAEDLGGSPEQYAYNSNKTDGISDGTLTGMQMVTAYGLGREFDYLQRLVERILPGGQVEKYNYASGEGENTTTTQVFAKMIMLGETQISFLKYWYDGNGNIQSVLDQQTGKTVTYTYDELNQLTGVVHPDGRTENYIYDAHGNLRLFNNGYTTHTYTYGNSDWKDLLTAVDGETLTYDEIGNPLTYYNGESYSLSWTEGRKLATITTDGKTTNYLYDANGNRIKKTNSDGSYILYVIANGTAIGEKHYSAQDELTKTLRYIYDENGSVCGYMENSADGGGTYYFIKNLQGDVTHVYRMGDNAIVATYSYDSWGNIISATGEKAEENPFRYRGYYYDVESGFYATGSRYYDPEIGRFISADGAIAGVGGEVLGYNMFAYCQNNPVNMEDPTGNWPKWSTILKAATIAIAAVAVVAAVAVTVATCGVTSIAATIVISSAITIGAKAVEVAALQGKKSAKEEKKKEQIVSDVVDSVFDNGGKIIGTIPVTKTVGYATGFYSQSSTFQDVVQLQKLDGFNLKTIAGAAAYEVGNRFTDLKYCISANANKGSMVLSYGFAAINVWNSLISIFSDNPDERANNRGYKLR